MQRRRGCRWKKMPYERKACFIFNYGLLFTMWFGIWNWATISTWPESYWVLCNRCHGFRFGDQVNDDNELNGGSPHTLFHVCSVMWIMRLFVCFLSGFLLEFLWNKPFSSRVCRALCFDWKAENGMDSTSWWKSGNQAWSPRTAAFSKSCFDFCSSSK